MNSLVDLISGFGLKRLVLGAVVRSGVLVALIYWVN